MVQDNSERRSHAAASARRDDLRQRLVAAAEAAVAQHGLESLKARTLAAAAGCSVGAIYDVFADLDGLVLAVNGRTLDAIDAALRERGDGAGAAIRRSGMARLADRLPRLRRPARGGRWRRAVRAPHAGRAGRCRTWYAARQVAAFSRIEAPLAAICGRTSTADARALLARSAVLGRARDGGARARREGGGDAARGAARAGGHGGAGGGSRIDLFSPPLVGGVAGGSQHRRNCATRVALRGDRLPQGEGRRLGGDQLPSGPGGWRPRSPPCPVPSSGNAPTTRSTARHRELGGTPCAPAPPPAALADRRPRLAW